MPKRHIFMHRLVYTLNAVSYLFPLAALSTAAGDKAATPALSRMAVIAAVTGV